MKNHLSTDDLIEKVAEFKEELQQLPQAQLDASIKDILSLTTTEYWDASGLKDEMDFYFDESRKCHDQTSRYLCPCLY